jgi:hypothetical protein
MLANQDVRQRVDAGKKQECLIIQALNRAGMNLSNPTNSEDLIEKVDAWGQQNGQRMGIQIKFRETGKDLLFEVFDTFFGFNNPKNKIGRDMKGIASHYAVKFDKNIVLVEKKQAEEVIQEMLDEARCNGWSERNQSSQTLYYQSNNHELQLKLQNDPADGRKKIVAYIPKEFFSNCKSYAA